MILNKKIISIKKNIYKFNYGIIKIDIGRRNILLTLMNYFNPRHMLFFTSAGKCGIRASDKRYKLALDIIITKMSLKVDRLKIKKIFLLLKGYCRQRRRKNILKMFYKNSFKIFGIKDQSLIAYNGCRPKKLRRDNRKMVLLY